MGLKDDQYEAGFASGRHWAGQVKMPLGMGSLMSATKCNLLLESYENFIIHTM